MPSRSAHGQPAIAVAPQPAWAATAAGRALLQGEQESVRAALGARPGQPWLWLGPAPVDAGVQGHGLRLQPVRSGWSGEIRCALPLPLANESIAAVVLQHVEVRGAQADALVQECARILVPGGRLLLIALNPLSPWRWRWAGVRARSTEPMPWRRRMRASGLVADPVSQGVGPRWQQGQEPALQHGPGIRAAWMLHAEKRAIPLTPLRQRTPLRIGGGVPAA